MKKTKPSSAQYPGANAILQGRLAYCAVADREPPSWAGGHSSREFIDGWLHGYDDEERLTNERAENDNIQ